VRPQRAPFPDELLTSWLARQNHNFRGRTFPEPTAVTDRKGLWRIPDINPPRAWLSAVSEHFDVPRSALAEITIAHRDPAMPLDFLSWDWSPFQTAPEFLRARPRLQISWCSQCLAEDFAAGRPAWLRQQWVFAASGFCHKHRWPLEQRCTACQSSRWRLSAPARGPLRMVCQECWRPLERTAPETLASDKSVRDCWDRIIKLEVAVMAALRGKTPDQYRFNFTSGEQLLVELRDIFRLLAGVQHRYGPNDCPLNRFACPAMTPGWKPLEFPSDDSPFPVAEARIAKRRSLLAAATAILDPRPETAIALFGQRKQSAIEMFVSMVDGEELDRCVTPAGRWSPTLVRRIADVRKREGRSRRIMKLQTAIARIGDTFPRCV
jgi:hypothetical protein